MKTNFALFLLIIFSVATVSGWGWPDIAKIMPVYVAAMPGLFMIIVQIYREATGWETRRSTTSIDMDESGQNQLDDATARKRTLAFFAWFIGGALGIWLIGIVYALPVLVFLYALLQGKEKWLTSLIIGGCAYLVIWGLFEYMLETRWPSGILFGY
ncbi:MAG TPA: tripartite tricarboxylate transporter TctB family protein [Candidatus Deferrimicrobium sp.]|nr:tripartite tricarboxylate transporter TctB family protein [Candidatus Deferrimicrobium sp.]